MSTPFPDTLSAAGTFPIVEGPVELRSYATVSLPSATALPAGTMVYDSTLQQPKITNGTVWSPIGGTVTLQTAYNNGSAIAIADPLAGAVVISSAVGTNTMGAAGEYTGLAIFNSSGIGTKNSPVLVLGSSNTSWGLQSIGLTFSTSDLSFQYNVNNTTVGEQFRFLGASQNFAVQSNVANGASAVAHYLNTTNTLSTAGAKLLSIANHNTEKVYVDKDGNLVNAQTQGTLSVGSQVNGANANQFLQYQPAESGAPAWTQYNVDYANTHGTARDQVMGFGWNVTTTGRIDATKAAFATVLESHYEPNAFTKQSEWYLSTFDEAGNNFRPMQVNAPHTAGEYPIAQMQVASLTLIDAATNANMASWSAGGMALYPTGGNTAIYIWANNVPVIRQRNAANSGWYDLIKLDASDYITIGDSNGNEVRAQGKLSGWGIGFRTSDGVSEVAYSEFAGGYFSITSASQNLRLYNGSSQVTVSPGAGTGLRYGNSYVLAGSDHIDFNAQSTVVGVINIMFGGANKWVFDASIACGLIPQTDNSYPIGTSSLRVSTVYTVQVHSGTSSMTLTSSVADGAGAIGTVINNTVTLSTAGAKILSVQNNSSEKLYVDKDGNVGLVGKLKNTTAGNETSTASAGAATLPANPRGFLSIIDSGGTTRKIPYYDV